MRLNPVASALIGLALVLVTQIGLAKPVMINHEDSIEGASVSLQMDGPGVGIAVVRECEACPPMRLKITPSSRAYANGLPVAINSGLNLYDKRVFVYYQVKDKILTRMKWGKVLAVTPPVNFGQPGALPKALQPGRSRVR